MYGVYDMKNNEQCIGVFLTRNEVAKYFDTSSNLIGASIYRKSKIKHRYLIVKIEENE